MKNPVNFRVGRSRLPQIGCLAIVFIMIATCGIVTSCKRTPKGQIELAFEEYIKKNLGNPNDYIETTDIVLIDSLNLVESANKFLEMNIDSLAQQTGQILYQEIMPSILKINPNAPMTESRRRELKELVDNTSSYARKSMAFAQHYPYVVSLRDSLKSMIGQVNPNIESNKEYLLKARIKVDNKPIIQEFHVLQTAIVDSIMISSKEIPMDSCPKAMTEILTMIKLYGKEVNELLEYRNDLIELQTRIKMAIGD